MRVSVKRSIQCKPKSGFPYNPLRGSVLHLFSADANPAKTRVFDVQVDVTAPGMGYVMIDSGTYVLRLTDSQQTTLSYLGRNGDAKKIVNYSVVYTGNKHKQRFSQKASGV